MLPTDPYTQIGNSGSKRADNITGRRHVCFEKVFYFNHSVLHVTVLYCENHSWVIRTYIRSRMIYYIINMLDCTRDINRNESKMLNKEGAVKAK